MPFWLTRARLLISGAAILATGSVTPALHAQEVVSVAVVWSRTVEEIAPNGVFSDATPTIDGRVLTADPTEDRAYLLDHRGRIAARFGGAGGGPGEVADLFDLGVDQDGTILLADGATRRIQRWDSGGRFLGVVATPPTWHFFATGPGGVFLRSRPPLGGTRESANAASAALTMRAIDSLPLEQSERYRVEWSEGRERPIPGEFCWFCPAVPVSPDTLVVGYGGAELRIGVLDRRGRVLRAFGLRSYKPVSYSADEIAAARTLWARRTGRAGETPEYLSRPKAALVTRSIGVDREHRIWVRPATAAQDSSHLAAFDFEGRLLWDRYLPYPADQIRVAGKWIVLLGQRSVDDMQVITLLEVR